MSSRRHPLKLKWTYALILGVFVLMYVYSKVWKPASTITKIEGRLLKYPVNPVELTYQSKTLLPNSNYVNALSIGMSETGQPMCQVEGDMVIGLDELEHYFIPPRDMYDAFVYHNLVIDKEAPMWFVDSVFRQIPSSNRLNKTYFAYRDVGTGKIHHLSLTMPPYPRTRYNLPPVEIDSGAVLITLTENALKYEEAVVDEHQLRQKLLETASVENEAFNIRYDARTPFQYYLVAMASLLETRTWKKHHLAAKIYGKTYDNLTPENQKDIRKRSALKVRSIYVSVH